MAINLKKEGIVDVEHISQYVQLIQMYTFHTLCLDSNYRGFLMVFSFLPKKCALYFKKLNFVFVS